MKEFFILQLRITTRRIKDTGVEPRIGYPLLLAGFIFFSIYLFERSKFAEYIYALVALTLTARLSETNRNEFIRIVFGDSRKRLIRIVENLVYVFPFIVFLLIRAAFLSAILLPVLAGIITLFKVNTGGSFTLPSPFSKKPFEYSSGFRRSLLPLTAAYVLSIVAVSTENFNLGIVAMMLVFAITMGYHNKPEDEFFVWIYKDGARQFLYNKIKTAILLTSLMVLPVAILLAFSFAARIPIILLFMLTGLAFLTAMVVSKYAAFPNELNLPEVIPLGFCVLFPPLLLILIPYLFLKSEKRLSRLLK